MTEKHVSSWAVNSPRRWRFHLWRGARSLEAGDLRGAQRHFAAAYREAPDEPLVCLAWGRELQRVGDPAAAEKLLRRAWEADPGLDTAGLHLARLVGGQEARAAEAEAILNRLATERGESAATLLLRAELRLRDPADPEVAKALLEQALVLGADEAEVRLGLARAFNAEGLALTRQGEHHRALFALKRAADLDPAWSGPLVNRGAILEGLGQLTQAQREYRRALSVEPTNPVALFNLADLLRRQGRRLEAARVFRRLLEVEPGYPGGALGLRRALEERPGGGDRVSPE